MKKITICALASFMLITLVGCNEQVNIDNSKVKLTSAQVKKNIVKGITTQKDVVLALGTPNMLLSNNSDGEVWTYDQVRVEKNKSGYIVGGFLLSGFPWDSGIGAAGGKAGVEGAREVTTVKTITVVIDFAPNGIVSDYKLLATSF